jgi:diaminobutyrate-2-oxoglutarate transaminase
MKPMESLRTGMHTFEQLESQVRSYSRSFPTVFTRSRGSRMWDQQGREYIDFFAGAGALNYGHNHPQFKEKIIEYLKQDGVTHSLDMATEVKEKFLLRFHEVILKPRGLSYKVMFPGPTGTNAVESALKLARKVTGREHVMCFTNAFHGMSLGSLAVSGNSFKREAAGVPLSFSLQMPFENYFGPGVDTVAYIERLLEDKGSGIPLPAALILETVQAEGGLKTASFGWLKRIEALCRRFGILLIVDDIQVGCGRTGPFFSFERAGIEPDLVVLSKSIGGFGLPMALTLIKPELDIWKPGEHNGTFRGNNLAFLTATEALSYWEDDTLTREVDRKADLITEYLRDLVRAYPELGGELRGRGLIQGIATQADVTLAKRITRSAFERGLIIETSGPQNEVVKLLPPLVIEEESLQEGLDILAESIAEVVKEL